MAPRATSAIMSDDFYHSNPESSPDPLAGSMNINSARARKVTRTTKQPLTSSSPSKLNRRPSIGEFEIVSSPSKSMVMNTPRGGGVSPWRIKVTVHAEPETETDDDNASPSIKRVTRTQTTTIPLKDPDAMSPVKRRGRPRKSDAAAAKAKRSGTPAKKTPRVPPKKRDTSEGANASAADLDTDATPKRKRGRPRKSIPVQVEETLSEPEPEPTPRTVLPVIETTFATPQEQENSAVNVVVLKGANLLPPTDRTKREPLKEYVEDIRFTPPQTELSQRIRARKGTPVARSKVAIDISSDEGSGDETNIRTPSGSDEDSPGSHLQHQPSRTDNDAAKEFGTAYAPSNDDQDEEDALQDNTSFAFEEGATRGPDDTTIFESENFSMISVDSLPSSGGLTSPVDGPTGRTPTVSHEAVRNHQFLKIPAMGALPPRNNSPTFARSSPGSSQAVSSAAPTKSSPVVAPPRHITPAINERSPSQPPPIETARPCLSEAETPKIGRVVKAGVALQGVLDPSRVTPEAGPSQAGDRRLSELDDLFRGFSERTRKELQVGLRLGEQLALEGLSDKASPAARSSPIRVQSPAKIDGDVFGLETKKRQARLPTPEEKDAYILPSPPTTQLADVQYPSLKANGEEELQLLTPTVSPARSDDEMSWRVDTPPVCGMTAVGGRSMTVINEHGAIIRGKDILVVGDREDEANGDLWEDEAGRSSILPRTNEHAARKSPMTEDLFTQDVPPKPARGKLPRTWRHNNPSSFHYSDEAEESPHLITSLTKSDEAPPQQSVDEEQHQVTIEGLEIERNEAPPQHNLEKGKQIAKVSNFEAEDDYSSEASDDTGMFFASNLPNVYNNNRRRNGRKRKAEKVDLTVLMNEGESLLPESSPPVTTNNAPGINKPNPFQDTPPRFAGYRSSPVKSSPLRTELHSADLSSSSAQQVFEESTLPLPPSSPFHTQVDGFSIASATSDQRQLRDEMANKTDSSLRNIRNEADEYSGAYELQDRSMGEIEEVTETSRTVTKDATVTRSSPVRNRHGNRSSPNIRHSNRSSSPSKSSAAPVLRIIAVAPRHIEEAPQPSTGIFGRLTSVFNKPAPRAAPTPHAPLRNHPIVFKFDRLPKVEPWTKTHYKTLDSLHQLNLKHPKLFAPSSSSPHSSINISLLHDFLSATQLPYVGARFEAWGYGITLAEREVVLCAVYMQLLTLEDAVDYEAKAGHPIQIGDCGPRESGETIDREEVVKRYITVVLGEQLRKDEKKGVRVQRDNVGLKVRWPGEEEALKLAK